MRMDQHIKRLIEKYTLEAPRLPKQERLEKFNLAYKQAKELGNPFTLRACAANLGAMFVSLADPGEAEKGLQYLEEALPPAGKCDGASNGDLYFNMGLACKLLGRYKMAGGHFEKAWQEYTSEPDNITMERETLCCLVQVSQMRQKPAEAVKWYLKLEDTYLSANKTRERLLVMVKRITLQHEHTMEGTQDALTKCCDMLDSIRNSGQDSVGLLVEVTVLLTRCQQLEKAREYLEEAQNAFEVEDGQTIEKAIVLQNLGTICNHLGDWEASLPYHQTAAEIYHHYAMMTPGTKTQLSPLAAKKCHGHVLANHAYACIRQKKVDEAYLLFHEAWKLAEESGDIDSKWQMEEALGAVHSRLAMHDVDLPTTVTASMQVALPVSRFEHMDKSIDWYKAALNDLARSPKRTPAIQDRVFQKLTKVQAFKEKASKVQYHLTLSNAAPVRAQVLRGKVDVVVHGVSGQPEESHEKGSDKKGSDEEGSDEETSEESGSSDDDDEEEEDSDKGDDGEEEKSSTDKKEEEDAKDETDAGATLPTDLTLTQKSSLKRRDQRLLNVTLSMQASQDTQNLKNYEQQLAEKEAQDEDESTPQKHNQTVREDVPPQKMQYSSSEETSSDSDEDSDSGASSSEDEDKDEGDEKGTRNARDQRPLNVTLSMQASQDDYLNNYEKQLAEKEARDEVESTPQRRNQTVRADVHPQKMQYSSSEETSSDSDEDSDSGASSGEDEDKDEGDDKGTRNARNRGPVPPVPTQSPPVTMKASGTYERPQDVDSEEHINPVYEGTVPAASNYAELDFARRKSKRGESHQAEDNRRMSLNFFISSSEEETERTTKQKNRDPQQEGESSGYEPVGPGRSGNRAQHQDGDSDAGDHPPLPENKKKNSRACVLM